jgi:hypothetical protein
MTSLTSLRANIWYPGDVAEPARVRPEAMSSLASQLASCASLRGLYLWNLNLALDSSLLALSRLTHLDCLGIDAQVGGGEKWGVGWRRCTL